MGRGWFSHKTKLVFVPGKVFKDGSRNSAPFEMELLATKQLVMLEFCKGLHLICYKELGSAPDFYVSHQYM